MQNGDKDYKNKQTNKKKEVKIHNEMADVKSRNPLQMSRRPSTLWPFSSVPVVQVVSNYSRSEWIHSVVYLLFKCCFKESHPDVEAQQVADHSRHSGQDDDPSDVVDQRVHSQTQQSKRSIQLLEQVRARGGGALLKPVNCFELHRAERSHSNHYSKTSVV